MLEWYGYYPSSYATVSTAVVRRTLPHVLQKELIQDPQVFQGLIAVDVKKTGVVGELDKLLRIDSSSEFQRHRFVEVKKNEISQFSYYHIVPMRIEPQDIEYELNVPQCDKCLWGLYLHPPITLSEKVRRRCEFCQAALVRSMDIELIISERIKSLFESEDITGLKYQAIDDSSFYLANITSLAWQRGDSIIMSGNYCERHLVVPTPVIIHPSTPVDEFQSDFVMIRGAEIGGKEYTYIPPWWAVSQKVLRLLLKEVKGLQRATIRLNEKFKPCLPN